MELVKQIEIEDLSPSTMQVVGVNNSSFGHNVDFMSQTYLRNTSSEIHIEDEPPTTRNDRPLPIYLKVLVLSLHIL